MNVSICSTTQTGFTNKVEPSHLVAECGAVSFWALLILCLLIWLITFVNQVSSSPNHAPIYFVSCWKVHWALRIWQHCTHHGMQKCLNQKLPISGAHYNNWPPHNIVLHAVTVKHLVISLCFVLIISLLPFISVYIIQLLVANLNKEVKSNQIKLSNLASLFFAWILGFLWFIL